MQKYKESPIWQNLFYAADGLKSVSIFFPIKDPLLIQGINPHITRRMYNTTVAHADTHMHHTPLVVLEEGEVVTLDVTLADLHAAGSLLRSVTWQPDTIGLETDLGEPRAVDAAAGTASPEVGGAEETALGQFGG